MPRVIVTTDPVGLPNEVSILLDEQVQALHVSSRHAADQLVERIAWAITDAEAAERSGAPARRTAPEASRDRPARVRTSRPTRRRHVHSEPAGARSGPEGARPRTR